MQSLTILDQQNDEHGDTVKTQELRGITTNKKSSTLYPVVTEILYTCQLTSMELQTDAYTAKLAKKTEDSGDCCMMSICEWGHARLEYEEDASYF